MRINNLYFLKLSFVFSLLLSLQSLVGQQNTLPCATNEVARQVRMFSPKIAKLMHQGDSLMSFLAANPMVERGQNNVHVIPVVVHVIYDNPVGNISDNQIHDALRVLNEDFRRRNADTVNTRATFRDRAADVEVEFRLATLDPSGNCTNGIIRIQSSLSNNANDNVKSLNIWPNTRYLNIWTVNTIDVGVTQGTVLGYAYRPFPGQPGVNDGIVIRHDRMGTIGTSNNAGRTLTHEVGHYLGLKHPFDDGCFSGDDIADTPPVSTPSFGCDLQRNSCNNDLPNLPDMIENYMDYANAECQNIFTQGQKTYMKNILNNPSLRGAVSSSQNLVQTGLLDNNKCLPVVNMYAPQTIFCVGEEVHFSDYSFAGGVTAREWKFPGGNPSVSNLENPKVTYAAHGVYDVELSLTNLAGTVTQVVSHKIAIRPSEALWGNWLQQSFENAWLPSTLWHVDDPAGSGRTFQQTQSAGLGDSYSARLLNGPEVAGRTYSIYSPTVDVRFSSSLNLKFDYAFARRQATDNDQLRVYVSPDCGKTWIIRRVFAPNFLVTAPDQPNGDFIPTQNDQWRNGSVFVGTFANSQDDIMFRWEFTSGGGNHIYIDNINLEVTLNNEEIALDASTPQLYPNPVERGNSVSLTGLPSKKGIYKIVDLSARVVLQENFDYPNNESLSIKIPNNIAAGVYLIQVEGLLPIRLLIK